MAPRLMAYLHARDHNSLVHMFAEMIPISSCESLPSLREYLCDTKFSKYGVARLDSPCWSLPSLRHHDCEVP
jgi:hypothetical protein